MNYLAHLLLSDQTPHGLIGNLIADFVKGNELNRYPISIQRGIRLHRQVDSFTDRHPLVHQSINRISARWGWFSGIIIDIYYDHLLATHFEDYCTISLRDYTDEVHEILREHIDLLQEEARLAILRLIACDRLYSYGTLLGMYETLESVSLRIQQRMPKQKIWLQEALPELQRLRKELYSDFQLFFPELVAFADEWNHSPSFVSPSSIPAVVRY